MSDGVGSSGERFKDAQRRVQSAEEKGVYIDWGMPLPETYNRDALYGLVRDPYCVVFYWELTGGRRAEIEKERGREILENGRWMLLVSGTGGEREFDIGYPAGTYYFKAEPSSEYIGKVGWRTEGGEFFLFAETPPVRTPADQPSGLVHQEFWSIEDIRKLLQIKSGGGSFGSLDVRSSLHISRGHVPEGEE
ncbi:MAG: DUF4912 domain-containing protein [Planctomycetota bacterium]|jgi:hypothetical protein